MLVIVSKGSTLVSACIELLLTRMLQFKTLRAHVRGGEGNGRGIIHE